MWMLLVWRTPPRSDLFDAPARSRLIVVSLLPKASRKANGNSPASNGCSASAEMASSISTAFNASRPPAKPSMQRQACHEVGRSKARSPRTLREPVNQTPPYQPRQRRSKGGAACSPLSSRARRCPICQCRISETARCTILLKRFGSPPSAPTPLRCLPPSAGLRATRSPKLL